MPDHASDHAAELSRLGASKGGKARAARLGPERRSEIARDAAVARWGHATAVATHAGAIQVGDRVIDCAVLEDGTRVINQRAMLAALERRGGARRGPGPRQLPLLSAVNLQPFISDQLRDLASNPIEYVLGTGSGGKKPLGYKAEVLPMVCEVYLAAREQKALVANQLPIALVAEILIRGVARVGITALIDEATGYQEVRARNELQLILEAYVNAELRPWLKMFPDEFFREIYRLQGWEFRPGTSKRTPYVGKLVNRYVYEQLPPGVLDELRRLNPRSDKGSRRHKHHQFLTADTGNPHLDKQISTVTTLLRIAHTKHDFESMFERAFPPAQQRLPLVLDSFAD